MSHRIHQAALLFIWKCHWLYSGELFCSRPLRILGTGKLVCTSNCVHQHINCILILKWIHSGKQMWPHPLTFWMSYVFKKHQNCLGVQQSSGCLRARGSPVWLQWSAPFRLAFCMFSLPTWVLSGYSGFHYWYWCIIDHVFVIIDHLSSLNNMLLCREGFLSNMKIEYFQQNI